MKTPGSHLSFSAHSPREDDVIQFLKQREGICHVSLTSGRRQTSCMVPFLCLILEKQCFRVRKMKSQCCDDVSLG